MMDQIINSRCIYFKCVDEDWKTESHVELGNTSAIDISKNNFDCAPMMQSLKWCKALKTTRHQTQWLLKNNQEKTQSKLYRVSW